MPNCKYCGKEFKNQGGTNLHEKLHCPKRPGEGQAAGTGSAGHAHTWRLLNPKQPQEKKAIIAGYEEICTKEGCGEIQ